MIELVVFDDLVSLKCFVFCIRILRWKLSRNEIHTEAAICVLVTYDVCELWVLYTTQIHKCLVTLHSFIFKNDIKKVL